MSIDLTPCFSGGLNTDELEAVNLKAKQVSLRFPKEFIRIPRSVDVLARFDMFPGSGVQIILVKCDGWHARLVGSVRCLSSQSVAFYTWVVLRPA